MQFVPAGVTIPRRPRGRVPSPAPLLRGAVDWKIEIDVGSNLTFPPVIVSTSARPDIVIWSCSTKTVIWGELTCPLEELIREAHVRKRARYLKLEIECRVKGWSVHAFQFEVGYPWFCWELFPSLPAGAGVAWLSTQVYPSPDVCRFEEVICPYLAV